MLTDQLNLSREYFASRDVFDQETERIFARNWLCVGHADEWPDPPSYRVVAVGRYHLVVTRPEPHQYHAFHNVCRHRGTRICDQASGALPQAALVCPYHAWTYSLTGQLIGAPNMADQTAFNRQGYSLVPVATSNWNGLILLHLGSPNSSFTTDAQPIVDRLASWSLGDLVLAATRRYEVRANWKLLFQNYNECYHCPTVHPALNRLTPYKTATNDLTSGPILGGPMELAEGFETVSRDGKLVAERFPQLTDDESRRVYYYTIFPTLFVSAHPDYVMVHILNRRDVALTEVTCHFLTRGSEPEPDPGSLARATDLWDEVNRQDWRVCELTQMGVESPACRPGPYSRLESMVCAFDRHYREVMG